MLFKYAVAIVGAVILLVSIFTVRPLSAAPPTNASSDHAFDAAASAAAAPESTPCPGGQTFSGAISGTDPTQAGRLLRDYKPSTCGAAKPLPVLASTSARHYDAYPFTNTSGTSVCVTVHLDSACNGLNEIYSVAYLGSFDPANPQANYLADSGTSPAPGADYAFTVPAGANYVVVVHEMTANMGCGAYTLTVSPCLVSTPTATNTNTAVPTNTPSNTPTQTATSTNTAVPTNTPSNTPTQTATSTNTAVPTNTPSNTPTQTATSTNTAVPPTNTTVAGTPTATPCPGGQTFGGAISGSDPTQAGRLLRDYKPSICGTAKTTPALASSSARHYDAYPFTNTSGSPICVTVRLDTACNGLNEIYSVAYLGSFNPANPQANYLADSGTSPLPTATYSFNVPAGASYVVVVHEMTGNTGCNAYTLTVNPCAGGPAATSTPTRTATNTAVPTNSPTRTATTTAVPPTNTMVATNSPTRTATNTAAATNTPASTATNTPPAAATNTPNGNATPRPGLPCVVLPANNVWNRNIAALPVHANSANYMNTIGLNAVLHPDFASGTWNGGPIGIPYIAVPGTQPLVPMTFTYYRESEPGPYPIPTNAPIQGGPNSTGDRHVIVVEQSTCTAYELFKAYPNADGSWRADAGAVWPLTSNALRPNGWTSADAAGLPLLPGLVSYDEVASGVIRHAIRFTAETINRSYIWPARHSDGQSTDANAPPMGTRLRLKASVDISSYATPVRVVLQALKDYGMILSDSGTSLDIGGIPDSRWNDNVMHSLEDFHGTDFEVVDESGLMVDPNSGQAR